jgi:hypothetical protein
MATITATRQADRQRGWFIGSYTGNAAALDIHMGFVPGFILAWNRTDGDTVWMWSGAVLTTQVSIVAAAATNTATVAVLDGSNGVTIGIRLPIDAVINESAKVYDFIAFPA